jgi:hypothetical protein
LKGFANSRGKSTTTDTFNKLVSNAIGDEYRDPGQYFLRPQGNNQKAFRQSGAQKLVKHSEFVHIKEINEHKPGPKNTPIGFNARSTSENF